MRDTHLPDGCAVKDYTDKVNELLDLHLPHFVNIKLEGAQLSKAIVNFMPLALKQKSLDIIEQSEKDKTIDDYLSLVTVCTRRVDAATDAGLADARMQMVDGAAVWRYTDESEGRAGCSSRHLFSSGFEQGGSVRSGQGCQGCSYILTSISRGSGLQHTRIHQ